MLFMHQRKLIEFGIPDLQKIIWTLFTYWGLFTLVYYCIYVLDDMNEKLNFLKIFVISLCSFLNFWAHFAKLIKFGSKVRVTWLCTLDFRGSVIRDLVKITLRRDNLEDYPRFESKLMLKKWEWCCTAMSLWLGFILQSIGGLKPRPFKLLNATL